MMRNRAERVSLLAAETPSLHRLKDAAVALIDAEVRKHTTSARRVESRSCSQQFDEALKRNIGDQRMAKMSLCVDGVMAAPSTPGHEDQLFRASSRMMSDTRRSVSINAAAISRPWHQDTQRRTLARGRDSSEASIAAVVPPEALRCRALSRSNPPGAENTELDLQQDGSSRELPAASVVRGVALQRQS